jgi:hypothetical protein
MKHSLEDFYDSLLTFAQHDDEKGAQKYIQEHFSELPEDVQGELLTRLYFRAAEDEVEEAATLGVIQERGIEAIEALEAIKKKLEAGT